MAPSKRAPASSVLSDFAVTTRLDAVGKAMRCQRYIVVERGKSKLTYNGHFCGVQERVR